MRWLLRVTFLRVLLVVGLALFFIYSPYDFTAMARRSREKRTENTSTPLQFAVVWPRKNSHLFVEGAATAVREINAKGGVRLVNANGKTVMARLVMHVYDEDASPEIGQVASRVVRNLNLSAVIGHTRPDGAISASITYQDNGLLYLSPEVSDVRLTRHGFWSTIRTTPDDAAISRAMVEFALTQGWRRAAILYVRDTYGTTYDRLLREDFGELHARWTGHTNRVSSVDLAFQGYYRQEQRSFYLLISSLLDQQCDVVFVVDTLLGNAADRSLTLLNQLREMGVKQPIVGTEEFHSQMLWQRLGKRANATYAPTMFNSQPSHFTPLERHFWNEFASYYKTAPTMHAHEAYEAVLLLAQAAERAHSKRPIKMATMFKSTRHWNGMQGMGAYHFSLQGGIEGKHIYIEEMKDGVYIQPTIPRSCVIYTNNTVEPEKSGRN